MYNLFAKANKKRAKRRGFTLIELVIVIVILGILAGVAALSFSDVTKSSKIGVAKANLRAIKSACQVYQAANNGYLPSSIEKIKSYLDASLKDDVTNSKDGFTYGLVAQDSANKAKGIKITIKNTELGVDGTATPPTEGAYYNIDGTIED